MWVGQVSPLPATASVLEDYLMGDIYKGKMVESHIGAPVKSMSLQQYTDNYIYNVPSPPPVKPKNAPTEEDLDNDIYGGFDEVTSLALVKLCETWGAGLVFTKGKLGLYI